jgi:exoribonuclease-2
VDVDLNEENSHKGSRNEKRWDRIVEMAAQQNSQFPTEQDSKARAGFLAVQKAGDLLRFPDLSLSVMKLPGPCEYVVEFQEETALGHLGLAVKNYTHSAGPNRPFPDLTI